MRFPIASLAALTIGATAAAYAQSAPTQKIQPEPARINDIQVSREGETISILVRLSQQPAAATARASGDDLVVEIDGVSLAKLALDPPAGSLVRHVEALDRKLTLSGAAFGQTSTVIYRNAVLIETKLAEPEMRGASLLANATPATIAPPAVPGAAPPVETSAKESPKTVLVAEAAPPPKPPENANALESHPFSPAPKPSAPKTAIAALAGIDAARCQTASGEIAKDPWALAALGDHALCLFDAGKTPEAKNRLDQLAAFSPEDWRVALGRAALDAAAGDASKAEIGYRTAAQLAPNDSIRAAITASLEKPADH